MNTSAPTVEPIDATGLTLSNVFSLIGWTHSPSPDPSHQGRRVLDAEGRDLGTLQAHEAWEILRSQKLIK